MKVFLGGTVNGSQWRTDVKEQLSINYFDPVVDEWNDAAYERELAERRNCNYLLYVLTPKMTGFYAVAEVTDDSYRRPDRTLYCFLPEDGDDAFTSRQVKEFERLGEIVKKNGANWLKDLDEVVAFLNSAQSTAITDTQANYDAFISYGFKESKGFANSIANRLSENNLTVYQDLNEIPLIINNEEYIYQQILKSDNFIYVISPNTVRSEYCKKELDFAIRYNKRIIPVLHNKLRRDIQFLDEIIAKKPIIEHKHPEQNLALVVKDILDVINTDKNYVRSHSDYLFQAQKWDLGGRKQEDLLTGAERKEALTWSQQKSDALMPLNIQLEYINASKNVSTFILPLLWLNKKTQGFTSKSWFDKVVLVFSLANPAALFLTLYELLIDPNATLPLSMWFVFFAIQLALTFDGIKHKNYGLFISMLLSMIITGFVIGISCFRMYGT